MEQQNGDPSTVKQRIEKLMKEITGDDRLNAKKAFRLLIDNIIVENQIVDITWKD
jgi:hypothetical protein